MRGTRNLDTGAPFEVWSLYRFGALPGLVTWALYSTEYCRAHSDTGVFAPLWGTAAQEGTILSRAVATRSE